MTHQAYEHFALTPEQSAALISNLVKEEKDAFFLKVTDAQWVSVEANMGAVIAYLGFDPMEIIKEFLYKSKNDKVKPDDKLITYKSRNGSALKLYKRNDAATDLLFFITLFLERGNNIVKILLKCDSEICELIIRKASAYGMYLGHFSVIRESGQSSSFLETTSVTLTLARLAQAFPALTASVILINNIQGKLKTLLAGVVTLPLLMQHTIFLSLIPADDEDIRDELKTVALVLNMEMSILQATPKDRRKLEKKNVDELTAQAEKFVSAAMNGSLITDDVKKTILMKGGILTAEGKLDKLATCCVVAAKAFLQLGNKTFNKAVRLRIDEMNKPTN